MAHWAVVLTYSPAGVYTDPCSLPTPCGVNGKERLLAIDPLTAGASHHVPITQR